MELIPTWENILDQLMEEEKPEQMRYFFFHNNKDKPWSLSETEKGMFQTSIFNFTIKKK